MDATQWSTFFEGALCGALAVIFTMAIVVSIIDDIKANK